MSTPHNRARKEDVTKTVLMPGDPLRTKFIAENLLEDVRLINDVRNMFAYVGSYRGQDITIMASGMGMPSMGIYSYELFKMYDVDNIIRIGTAGSYVKDLNLFDVVLADSVWSESNFSKQQNCTETDVQYPSKSLNKKILISSIKIGIPIVETRVHSTDVFYTESNVPDFQKINSLHECTCVDMESFALFHNAKVLGKNAACLLTISDSLVTNEKATSEEREVAFINMIKVALETAVFELGGN